MIERPGRDGDRDLRRMVGGVELVGELRVPIAEAAGGIGEPGEIAVGAAPQRLLRRWRPVFERLQLRDLIEQIREVALLGAVDRRFVFDVGAAGDAREKRRDQTQRDK